MTINLGNENENGCDFMVNGKYGEAFNVAPSFFDNKLKATLKKWSGIGQLSYILYNGELEVKISKKSSDDIKRVGATLIPVVNWMKKY